MIAGALSLMIGCGGTTAEKETPKPKTNITATNANASNPPAVTRNDGDADDMKTSSQTLSNNSNANRVSKSSDRDDSKASNRPAATNRPSNRRDDDDRGKKDSDDEDR